MAPSAFRLPDHLSPKADPALIAAFLQAVRRA